MAAQYDLKYSTNTCPCHFTGHWQRRRKHLLISLQRSPLCPDLHVDVSLTHTIHLNSIAGLQPPPFLPRQPYHKALAWPSNPAGVPVQESIHGMQLNHGCFRGFSTHVTVPAPTDTSRAPLEMSGQVGAVLRNKVGTSTISGRQAILTLAEGFCMNYS